MSNPSTCWTPPTPGTVVVLIEGSREQLSEPAPVKDLYRGDLFQASRAFAEGHTDIWFVMTDQEGILHPETILYPSDLNLALRSTKARDYWKIYAAGMLCAALYVMDVRGTVHLVVLASDAYDPSLEDVLQSALTRIEISDDIQFTAHRPFAGKTSEECLAWLADQALWRQDDAE